VKLFASFKQKTQELSEDMPTYPGIQMVGFKEKGNLSFSHLMRIPNMNVYKKKKSNMGVVIIHSDLVVVVILLYLMIQISMLILVLILAILIPL